MGKRDEIYSQIDENMRRPGQKPLKEYAKSKGCNTYTGYICESLKTKTEDEILAEMRADNMLRPPTTRSMKNLKYRVASLLKPVKKICRREGCNKRVPEDNWWFCTSCARANKRVNVDPVFYRIGN